VAQPDNRYIQKLPFYCVSWSGKTDTDHNRGSHEKRSILPWRSVTAIHLLEKSFGIVRKAKQKD